MGRRITVILLISLLLLSIPVSAENRINSLVSGTTVDPDGSCQVSLTLTLHLDQPTDDLDFPIPAEAGAVRLGGKVAVTGREGPFRTVSLSRYTRDAAGDVLITVQYTVPDAVTADDTGKLTLNLPMLCGFAYPVERMEFTVTLPGAVTVRPTFSSGYFQESIESYLTFTVSGATVSGATTARLADHETLNMTMELDPELFTLVRPMDSGFRITDVFAIVCAALALLYWLITMRCLPLWPIRRPTAPAGLTAGELGSRLTGAGPDLTMTVISWAQLGYLLIQLDDNGRVLLHKRMEMGNERSAFENRCFRELFGRKRMMDGSGYHYARLCRRVAAMNRTGGIYRKRSGNPRILAVLTACTACFVGLSLALYWGTSAFVRVLLVLLLGSFGVFSAWVLRIAALRTHLRHSQPRLAALICAGVWLILGLSSGLLPLVLLGALTPWVGGLAVGYGGRRTELGRQTMQDILGLRRHLNRATREELLKIARLNPQYFYEMAPYALALGVDKAFARHYGAGALPECSYLLTRHGSQMTASEWMRLLRDAAELLDERQLQLPLERILGK